MTVKMPVGMATSLKGAFNSLALGTASTKDYIKIQKLKLKATFSKPTFHKPNILSL